MRLSLIPNVISLIIILLFISASNVSASCALRFTSPYDAVVGIVEGQTDTHFHLRKLLMIKGRIPRYFDVKSDWYTAHEPVGLGEKSIVIPKPTCAGCSPAPFLVIGKTYFTTLYSTGNTDIPEYQIPAQCYRIFGEVWGWYDPRAIGYAIAVYSQPLWMGVLAFLAFVLLVAFSPEMITSKTQWLLIGISLLFISFCIYRLMRRRLKDSK